MAKTLQSLKAELKQLNEILSLDLTNWDMKTKSGMQGRQNAARVRIDEVRNDLGYFILKNSVTVLLMRDYAETGAVIDSARKNPDANIVLDALMIEKKLFKQLFEEKATAYTYNTQIVNHINVLMSEIGMKIGATTMDIVRPDAKWYGTLRTREAMIARLEEVLYETYQDELKKAFFASIIVDEVFKRTHRDSVNVVIANVVPNMVRAFSSFAGSTQVLANGADGGGLPKKPAPAPRATKPASTVQTPVTAPKVNQIGASAPIVETAPVTSSETEKPAYTGKKRGRKTNAERAAIAAAQGTTPATSQNEG